MTKPGTDADSDALDSLPRKKTKTSGITNDMRLKNMPFDELRHQAQKSLSMRGDHIASLPAADAESLLEELQIHQIELEMQNHELLNTQVELETSREKYIDLYDYAPVGYLTLDSLGVISEANLTATKLLNNYRKDILGRKLSHFVYSFDQAMLHRHIQDVFLTTGKHSCEICFRTDTNIPLYIRLESEAVEDEHEVQHSCRTILIDITESKQAQNELLKLSRAVEASPTAVLITDINGIIEYVNPKLTEITGYDKEYLIGKSPRILQSGITLKSLYTDLWNTILCGKEWRGELSNRKKNGDLYWARNSISSVRDTKDKITHFIAMQEDMTHEVEITEQLNFQATHDALTGLINRLEFERRAERLLAMRQKKVDVHALCFLDLDQFKIVNDTCGHMAGDEMLRQISMVLQHEVRQRDTLARLGGDEFAVLMEHCPLDQAQRVTWSLLKAIQDFHFCWEDHTFKVGVSIGLVAITEITADLSELLKHADAACYMAKDQGRNRIHVYHENDADLAYRHGEIQWVERINQALEEDRFCLYAQTIMPFDERQGTHYELLLRMIGEKGQIIVPGAFLSAAERYGLIIKLDSWVIRKTFALLSMNPAILDQIHLISINLSGHSLAENSVLELIVSLLDETGLDAEKICFEITETAAISNLTKAQRFISSLQALGCRFALDDFGSGLSSFGYLKNLPVDYLKIDGLFIRDIVDNPIDYAMVKSINEIAQLMGMQTVAEFVENDQTKMLLKKIGVNYVQGYGISKPQPFEPLLDRSS